MAEEYANIHYDCAVTPIKPSLFCGDLTQSPSLWDKSFALGFHGENHSISFILCYFHKDQA